MGYIRNIKRKKNLSRQIITQIIVAFLVSIFLFSNFSIGQGLYTVIVILVWMFLILNYDINKNTELYISAITIGVVNGITCSVFQYSLNHVSGAPSLLHGYLKWYVEEISWGYDVICMAIYGCLIIGCIICMRNREKEEESEEEKLFSRRKADIEKIEIYLEKSHTVGVNGTWGAGKSFLMNKVKEHLENEKGTHIFIEVDLLACNLDEIQVVILSELERVLSAHKILPRNSVKLRRIFQKNSIYHSLQMLFMNENMTYSNIFQEFQNEIKKIDKEIVIVYEDIDRITNSEVIKIIFSISEKLSSEGNIKIVYQFDESKFEKLGFDKHFLEKYIPYTVNVTAISYKELFEKVMYAEGIEENILSIKDIHELMNRKDYTLYIDGKNYYEYIIPEDKNCNNIRTIERFVKEVHLALEAIGGELSEEYRKFVVKFFYVKYFIPDSFKYLIPYDELMGWLMFQWEEEEYSILGILAMCKQEGETIHNLKVGQDLTRRIFQDKENSAKLRLLQFLGYKLDVDSVEYNAAYMNETRENVKATFSNDKRDRIIWNLLCAGNSKYTNMEVNARRFLREVLQINDWEEQKKAYNKFKEDAFHGNYENTDNATINIVGESMEFSLVQALMCIEGVTDEEWVRFINLYFRLHETKEITEELIRLLNFVNIASVNVYMHVLKRFNELEIISNMNQHAVNENGRETIVFYKRFVRRYLSGISSHGYVDTHDLRILDSTSEIYTENVMRAATDRIKNEIEKRYTCISLSSIQEEAKLLVEFIDKNIAICQHEKDLEMPKSPFKVEITEKTTHQDEYNRLLKIKNEINEESFLEEVVKSRDKRKLSPYEVEKLLQEK